MKSFILPSLVFSLPVPFNVLEEVLHSIGEVLHVKREVRADTEKFFDSGQQLRTGEKTVVETTI